MDSPTGSSMSEKQGAQPEHTVNIRDVDVAAGLDSDKPLDPNIATRIRYVYPKIRRGLRWALGNDRWTPCRRKIDWHIMPFMCSTQPSFLGSFIWEINMFSISTDSHVSVSWKVVYSYISHNLRYSTGCHSQIRWRLHNPMLSKSSKLFISSLSYSFLILMSLILGQFQVRRTFKPESIQLAWNYILFELSCFRSVSFPFPAILNLSSPYLVPSKHSSTTVPCW